jgi:hypothetical protein
MLSRGSLAIGVLFRIKGEAMHSIISKNENVIMAVAFSWVICESKDRNSASAIAW